MVLLYSTKKEDHSINISLLTKLISFNLNKKQILDITSELNWPKNDVYKAILDIKHAKNV